MDSVLIAPYLKMNSSKVEDRAYSVDASEKRLNLRRGVEARRIRQHGGHLDRRRQHRVSSQCFVCPVSGHLLEHH